jgi:GntR family transcriptional regulator / MocR family aminotransferase
MESRETSGKKKDQGSNVRSRSRWTEFLDLSVDPRSELPLLQQVYLLLRGAILSHALMSGSRLPSTRQLADRLGVSRTSVLSAYDQLLAEGYVEGRAGSGTYVTQDVPQPILSPAVTAISNKKVTSRRLSNAGTRFQMIANTLGPPENSPFNTGCASVDAITIEAWRRVGFKQAKAIEAFHRYYADPMGELSLRVEAAQYLRAARAVRCEPEQIVIVSGAQQALDLSLRALINPGDAVWVEDPGYLGARAALNAIGAHLIPVPVDENGLVVSAGIRARGDARAAYITPSHQYPTGAVMSMRRRLEILAWAQDNDAWIIEDDYDSEFRYVGRPLASLQGIDEDSRVIYVGTLSKMLFPGIRIGFAVVPLDLVEVFKGAKFVTDRQPPSLQQAMVTDFMKSGSLTSHIRRMRVQYREARDVVVKALTQHMGDLIDVEVPECGIQLLVLFKNGISDVEVAQAARAKGLFVRPLSSLYLTAPARQGLLLGYSGFDLRSLRSASRMLSEIVRIIHRRGGSTAANLLSEV